MAGHSQNHIVTRAHLALFARDGKVECHMADGGVKRLSPTRVAVRSNIYVTQHPDGRRDTSFERSLTETENAAIVILRSIRTAWPLDGPQRAALAEYIALQMVRTPDFGSWLDESAEVVLAAPPAEHRDELTDAQWESFTEHMRSNQQRNITRSRLIGLAGTTVGHMHWRLVRFSSPKVVISDHPLSALTVGAPAAPHPPRQIADLLEMRLPIDPWHVLVMSWVDVHDALRPFTGTPEMLRAVNAATVRQAEQHWCHRPGANPPHTRRGDAVPLSVAIFGDAATRAATSSRRAELAGDHVRDMIRTNQRDKLKILRAA